MAPRRGRESKQGLVIALVLVVLAWIGTGVAAYYGFNGKETALKETADEKRKTGEALKARDWYKFQAQLYRAYMGHTEGVDFTDLSNAKSQFASNALGSGEKDKEGVTKLINETLDPKFWDAAQNRPKRSYEAALQQEKERSDSAEKTAAAATEARQAAEKAAKKAQDDLKAERASFDEKLAQLNKKAEVDLSKYIEETGRLREELKRLSETNEQIRKVANDDKKKSDDALVTSAKKLRDRDQSISSQKEQIQQLMNKGVDIAPKSWQTDWRIVSIDRTGAQPFINLGSADHVKPQLTFSIHAQGPDGRPVAESKGSLEVVTVLGEHLAQARLLTVKDRNKEPILKGDILFNPTWSPTQKKHIALAGVIDLAGDGQDLTMELIRNLERQNIVVDAYLDPRDNTVKGKGITVQTDYLVIGEPVPEINAQSDVKQESINKRIEEINKLKKAARENGVQEVFYRKYLDVIGYRLPRTSIQSGGGNQEPLPVKAPAAAPAEGAEPAAPKKDDKPAEDKPAAEKPAEEKPK